MPSRPRNHSQYDSRGLCASWRGMNMPAVSCGRPEFQPKPNLISKILDSTSEVNMMPTLQFFQGCVSGFSTRVEYISIVMGV
jgi:hypothetical protein